jgi:hypothetical protein
MTRTRYPSLFQINTRVWLTQLPRDLRRRATLDDIPDVELVLICGTRTSPAPASRSPATTFIATWGGDAALARLRVIRGYAAPIESVPMSRKARLSCARSSIA